MSNEQANHQPIEEQGVDTSEAMEQGADEEQVQEQELSPVEKLEQQLHEMKDQFLRAVAENDNLQKRAQKEQAQLRKYAVTEFAKDMAGVCENLYRALDSITPDMLEGEENAGFKNLHTGVDMTRNELLRGFEKHGLKRIMPERGEAFDHNIHQAVSQIEDAELTSGQIANVVQAGYQIHDRLLQPCMVVVAK